MSTYPYMTPGDDDQIVYVRRVNRADLPKPLRDETKGMDAVWSIHDAAGQILAFVDDRDKAFRVARMNERHPVSVH